jgi:hypothetical protein
MITEKEKEAKENLKEFVDDCTKILKPMLTDGPFKGFKDIENRDALKEALNTLGITFMSSMDEVKQSIDGLDEKALSKHGLYGDDLKSKLSLFCQINKSLEKASDDKLKKRLLKWLLKVIRVILGSILDASKVGEALKEIVDLVFDSIDITDDLNQDIL